MALSKEVNIKNQMCISSAMLIFHKYILTHQFSIPLELVSKNYSIYNYLDIALSDVNEAFGCLVSEVEIFYLAAFFLATKISNCLTSITKLIQYYVNTSAPIISYLSSELGKEHNKLLKELQSNTCTNKQSLLSSVNENHRSNASYNNLANAQVIGLNINNGNASYGSKVKLGLNKCNIQLGYINNFSLGNNTLNCAVNCTNYNCHHSNLNNLPLPLKENTREGPRHAFNQYPHQQPNNSQSNGFSLSQLSVKEPSDYIKQHLDNRIKLREMEILTRLGFDLNLDLPYIYVEKMKPYIVQYIPKSDKFIGIINNFINDSFKLPVCLFHSPLKIALSAVYLLSVHFNIELVSTKEGIKWYQLIDPETSLEEVVEIAELINLIYQLPSKTSKRKTSVEAFREVIHACANLKVKFQGEKEDFQSFTFLNKKREHGVLSIVDLDVSVNNLSCQYQCPKQTSISNSHCEVDEYQESTINTETSSDKDYLEKTGNLVILNEHSLDERKNDTVKSNYTRKQEVESTVNLNELVHSSSMSSCPDNLDKATCLMNKVSFSMSHEVSSKFNYYLLYYVLL